MSGREKLDYLHFSPESFVILIVFHWKSFGKNDDFSRERWEL